MLPKQSLFVVISCALLLSCVQEKHWGTHLDKYVDKEGVKVELGRGNNGELTRRFVFKGGVTVIETKNNNEIDVLGIDEKGAVLCAREMAISVLGVLTYCPIQNKAFFTQEIMWGLDKIDHFIVENSLEPITLEELRAQKTSKIMHYIRNKADKKEILAYCNDDFPKTIIRKGAVLAN